MQNRILNKINTLKQLMQQDGFGGLVITNNIDQFYLLDFYFYSGEAVLLLHEGGLICFTRQLYANILSEKYPFMTVVGQDKQMMAAAVQKAHALGLVRVGFDAAKENYLAGSLFKSSGFVEAKSYISQLRQVKDEHEISILRESCKIAYDTYEYIRPWIKTGMTEFEVAAEMEKFMRIRGASATSFLTIVCFGENTSNPHHATSDRVLKDNEAVLIDFGCIYKGYCSDMTRSWWHNGTAPEEYQKIWKLTEKAWKAGIAAEKPGTACQAVDALSRGIISQGGYGPYFTHRLGHGVGLEIHEEPCNDQTSDAILQAGHVVTVEPGIYLPGKYGVRLEETTVITDTGADILTRK
ncbi:MAG: aminopeptidase P family protein [Elusimicrobiaceae bacterium]|nr:aminopeptidase P family protein [Elusimicrobiaceae bacterium]